MIKADPGWKARFEYRGGVEHVAIVAWSEEGVPLVVHADTGKLLPVDEVRDKGTFRRVVHEHVRATVPGDGWTVRRNARSRGVDNWSDLPVAAFEISDDGAVHAVVLSEVRGTPGRFRLGGDGDFVVLPPYGDNVADLSA